MPLAMSPVSLIELQNHVMLNQGLIELEFGFIKPRDINCPNPEATLGMGGPMVYAGFVTNDIHGL
jgi:hypothetical protein